ncbi:MAG: DnaJ family domain-containing protein [Burkholderiaceae bacterium]
MSLDGFPGLAALLEKRIAEAAAKGELSGLPGEGRPLDLDDDAMVPPELRVAYRIVRNAGLLPPELAEIAARCTP